MKPSSLLVIISLCFFVGTMLTTVLTSSFKNENSQEFLRALYENGQKIDPLYKEVEFDMVWSSSHEALVNPYESIVNKSEIYIKDYRGIRPIAVFDTKGAFLRYLSNWGRGAGEINLGYRILGSFNGELLVFDDQTKRLLSLDSRSGDSLFEKTYNLHDPILVGSRIVERAKVPFPGFAYGAVIEENLEISTNTTLYGNYEELPELQAAEKNHLLKQGPWAADSSGNVFFAFHDSSLILGFSSEGKIIFKTALPYQNSELPDFITHRASPEPLSAPNRDEYPKQYISLTVDDNFIYGLYSGFQIRSRQDILLADKLIEGNLLNIFDKKTSQYLFTIRLEDSFRDITVTEDAIYAITINPKVMLIKFHKPEIFL